MTELHRKHPGQSRLKLAFRCGVLASAVLVTGEWDGRHAHGQGVLAAAAPGQPSGPKKASDLVSVRVVADTEAVSPGESFHLAVVFDIRDKWHTYWINPGSSGAPTSVKTTAPAGFDVGAMRFPRPWTHEDSVGMTYGYEKQVAHFIPVTAPQNLTHGEATFDLNIFYLVCRDRCLMGREQASITLPTMPTEDRGSANKTIASTGSADDTAMLKRFRNRLPQPIEKLSAGGARLDGATLIIEGDGGEHGDAIAFLPIERPGVTYGEAKIAAKADGAFTIRVPVEIKPQNMTDDAPPRVEGLLTLGDSLDDPSYEVSLVLPERLTRSD